MSCDRVAVYVEGYTGRRYTVPVPEGATSPDKIVRNFSLYSLTAVLTSEDVPVVETINPVTR
jgi:hypothetical protein